MSGSEENESADNSTNDIINTFNEFFKNVPIEKSFDMSYKVYLRELADMDDHSTLSTRSSSTNIQEPKVLASFGTVPNMNSTSATSSSTEEFARKDRSMVSLTEIHRKINNQSIDSKKKNPDWSLSPTFYNLSILKPSTPSELPPKRSTSSTAPPSTFTKKEKLEFEKIIETTVEENGENGGIELYVNINDCFN
ncbi:hypothetical protein CRE_29057 [Caenorhabditis remanei]|uniref:Uncharacterized protein n=1 Tax=Caenorhabditis remanei TaxID=31234 RepID=E3MWB2_CAERE|nr:hypothetical protein CRE_29057 [Caenorhabditis remanei]